MKNGKSQFTFAIFLALHNLTYEKTYQHHHCDCWSFIGMWISSSTGKEGKQHGDIRPGMVWI